MEKIQWDDSLSVGVDLIDEQHKALIKRIHDVHEAVSTSMAGASIAKTLDFLIDYTEFHFGTEERHMAAHEYPGMDAHLKAHREFKTTLGNLGEDFREEGATASLAEAIDTLLFKWLLKHIQVVDQELGRFVNEKGIEMEGEVE
jgi:hemerythrin